MNQSDLTIKSPSKINLGLKIINKRDDGYHNIYSVFIELSLCDVLTFIQSDDLKIEFFNNNLYYNIKVPSKNTVSKAVDLISSIYNIDIKHTIIINKNIPIGGGLGGGSSNGAYTLIALNKLYNLNITNESLCNLANQIGSDVPFFIHGGIKKISGMGNIIEDIPSSAIKNKVFLLVIPSFSVSTKEAYQKTKKHLSPIKITPKFPSLTNEVDWTLFENDFEHIVCLAYPEILDIKSLLYKLGALYSGLSGSGSTMFGIYNDIKSAQIAAESLDKYQTHIAFPNI